MVRTSQPATHALSRSLALATTLLTLSTLPLPAQPKASHSEDYQKKRQLFIRVREQNRQEARQAEKKQRGSLFPLRPTSAPRQDTSSQSGDRPKKGVKKLGSLLKPTSQREKPRLKLGAPTRPAEKPSAPSTPKPAPVAATPTPAPPQLTPAPTPEPVTPPKFKPATSITANPSKAKLQPLTGSPPKSASSITATPKKSKLQPLTGSPPSPRPTTTPRTVTAPTRPAEAGTLPPPSTTVSPPATATPAPPKISPALAELDKISVTSDREAEFEVETGSLVFEGNAVMDAPAFKMEGDRISVRVSQTGDKIENAQALGMAMVEITKPGSTESVVGKSAKAEFDPSNGSFTLSGWPEVTADGQREVAATAETKMILYIDGTVHSLGATRPGLAGR